MRKKEQRNRYPFGNRHEKTVVKKKYVSAFLEEAKVFLNEVQVSVQGNREIFIEGVLSIAEYDDGLIRLITRTGKILVIGADLTIAGYGPTVMTITGKIGGITWE